MDVSPMLHSQYIYTVDYILHLAYTLVLKDNKAGLFYGEFRWNYWQSNSCCASFWITTQHPTAAYSKSFLLLFSSIN